MKIPFPKNDVVLRPIFPYRFLATILGLLFVAGAAMWMSDRSARLDAEEWAKANGYEIVRFDHDNKPPQLGFHYTVFVVKKK